MATCNTHLIPRQEPGTFPERHENSGRETIRSLCLGTVYLASAQEYTNANWDRFPRHDGRPLQSWIQGVPAGISQDLDFIGFIARDPRVPRRHSVGQANRFLDAAPPR
jgi:hypothetical protein